MDKIKIIYLITKSNWGGAQRYVYDLATGLPRDMYDVEVIVGGTGTLLTKLEQAGIKATSLPNLGRDIDFRDDIKVFFELIKIFRREKPAVVHVNSSKIGGLGGLAARIAGVPKIIFTAHGWAFNENRGLISKALIKILYWITITLSHITIAVSKNIKNRVRVWPGIDKKMLLVHNGISKSPIFTRTSARHELITKFAGKDEVLKVSVAQIPPSKLLWLGTIAELHPIKGHDVAIRGIKTLLDSPKFKETGKQVIYTIVGSGEEQARLLKLCDELGLSKNVFFLGHIDNAAQYMKAFDIFLLASYSEALAYVLLEAGLAEIPCIATAVGGIPEIIDDMKSGILIQPGKPSEVSHAIEFMVKNESIKKGCAQTLHQKVISSFGVGSMIEKTRAIYEK